MTLTDDLIIGITHFNEFNELTPDFRRTLIEMIWKESDSERYAKPMENENLKILCEADAYIQCCKNAGLCNLDRCKDPYSYIVMIIRCSFAKIFAKHGNFKKRKIEI
jgi:hypothetical protein